MCNDNKPVEQYTYIPQTISPISQPQVQQQQQQQQQQSQVQQQQQ